MAQTCRERPELHDPTRGRDWSGSGCKPHSGRGCNVKDKTPRGSGTWPGATPRWPWGHKPGRVRAQPPRPVPSRPVFNPGRHGARGEVPGAGPSAHGVGAEPCRTAPVLLKPLRTAPRPLPAPLHPAPSPSQRTPPARPEVTALTVPPLPRGSQRGAGGGGGAAGQPGGAAERRDSAEAAGGHGAARRGGGGGGEGTRFAPPRGGA